MQIDIYLHIVQGSSEVLARLDVMSQKMDLILQKENQIMSAETDALDKLEANTAAISGAEDSAEAAFLRLADMIAALKTSTTDPATAARITAASDALKAKADALAAAVAATPT